MEDTESDSSGDDNPWFNWFFDLPGHHLFCRVHDDFIKDNFNHYGLKQIIGSNYSKAMEILLDTESLDDSEKFASLRLDTMKLYGLIHSRFIISPQGLEEMLRKFREREFGECPRALCNNFPVLPMGLSDECGQESVRLFCPKCEEVYRCSSRHRHVDGAYFGPTFPGLFLLHYDLEFNWQKEREKQKDSGAGKGTGTEKQVEETAKREATDGMPSFPSSPPLDPPPSPSSPSSPPSPPPPRFVPRDPADREREREKEKGQHQLKVFGFRIFKGELPPLLPPSSSSSSTYSVPSSSPSLRRVMITSPSPSPSPSPSISPSSPNPTPSLPLPSSSSPPPLPSTEQQQQNKPKEAEVEGGGGGGKKDGEEEEDGKKKRSREEEGKREKEEKKDKKEKKKKK